MKDNKRISKKQTNASFTGRFSATRGFMPNQSTILAAFNSARINSTVQPASTEEPCIDSVPEIIEIADSSNNRDDQDDLQNEIPSEQGSQPDLKEDFTVDQEEEFVSDSLPQDSFLISYFQKIQSRLCQEDCPSEYSRGTFWIEQMMPYFMLKKKKKIESFYQPRFICSY
ncbi:hypothetical protein BD560DRAFT_414762 [Blakeslea trispora]|nr:hypothetical protein BD560DRAFT_414762 [Blakeslea trispora]